MKLQDDKLMEFLDRCDAAGIRNPTEFLISKMPQCYGWLKGAFPRGILPTDIDGEVEINGRFLRFEFKQESRLRNGEVPKGQLQCFEKLVRTGFHTIFLIGQNADGRVTCLQMHGRESRWFEYIDEDGLYKLCRKWATWAEKQPGSDS